MSKQEVFRWHKKFEDGFIHLKDASRAGQLKTGVTNATRNIIVVTGLVKRDARLTVYSYFMSVCSIVKTITPRCRGRPDALLHDAEGMK